VGTPLSVAVVGATGAVGRKMVELLEARAFPVASLRLLASPRSAGTTLPFSGEDLRVEALGPRSFDGIELALFSAGAAASREHAPRAVAAGAVVVDNSSAWRTDESVPLVVPEVNPGALAGHDGLIANPNCSTIQLVVVLRPLHEAAGLRRVVVSTYQSAAGAGQKGTDELLAGTRAALAGEPVPAEVHARPLAFDCVPQIDVMLDDGSSREEWKMVFETRRILGLPDLRVLATCVRVPVACGHAEAVSVELERDLPPEAARELLSGAPGVRVVDLPDYPTPRATADTDPCWVGRLRRDPSVPHGLALWVVADNLRKGAALNAVQIAEGLAGGA